MCSPHAFSIKLELKSSSPELTPVTPGHTSRAAPRTDAGSEVSRSAIQETEEDSGNTLNIAVCSVFNLEFRVQ